MLRISKAIPATKIMPHFAVKSVLVVQAYAVQAAVMATVPVAAQIMG